MMQAKLVAGRIHGVLGLALTFCSIQRQLLATWQQEELTGGSRQAGLGSFEKAKAGMDQVERQFDQCMAFLLQVLPAKGGPGTPYMLVLLDYNNFYMSPEGLLKVRI
eukprot:jgi/Mesen1/8435/ME000475S07709